MLYKIKLDLIDLTLIYFGNKNQIIALLIMNNQNSKHDLKHSFYTGSSFNLDTFPSFCCGDKFCMRVNLE